MVRQGHLCGRRRQDLAFLLGHRRAGGLRRRLSQAWTPRFGGARLLAFADTLLCSVVVEVGDGMTSYGFSWQDIGATVAGAGVYAFVASKGLEDTIGF